MSSVNKVILIGNLGVDPEIRYTTSGTAVATINIATNRRWKDKDGNLQDETEWHRVIAWSGMAEFAGEYLHKGSKVYVEGRLQTRKWKDQHGVDRYTTEIVANTLNGLDRRRSEEPPLPEEPPVPENKTQPHPSDNKNPPTSTGDDVPF